jgi:iron-sulfur cluster assembly protein
MVHLSESAALEVKRLRQRQHHPETAALRVTVDQSGCSGLSYHMEFVNPELSQGDRQFRSGDLEIFVDRDCVGYLVGLEIDYTEDLMGGGFRFKNPQAVKTCSCGHSFAIESLA